jgi:threonine/homoserine/homoserine lactone efflux protein
MHVDLLVWLKYLAAGVFVVMAAGLLWSRSGKLTAPSQLTQPGFLPGFVAGLFVIIGNPKAILFYIGILPGFFDVATVTAIDIAFIGALSAAVPFCGNIALALMLGRARALISSPSARRRLNVATGLVLIMVAVAILLM